MKEVLRELDESKLTREEVMAQSKDSEKKIQTLEAEVLQLTEVRVPNGYPADILRSNAFKIVLTDFLTPCLLSFV